MTNNIQYAHAIKNMKHIGIGSINNLECGLNKYNIPRFRMDRSSQCKRKLEESSQIKIDLSENELVYIVRTEIKRMKKDEIKVVIDRNWVSISIEVKESNGAKILCRECFQGGCAHSFSLDSPVDATQARAKYDGSVLELILPKRQVLSYIVT